MATKEDILEQIVEEFLIHHGYFVQHNVKFLPRRTHSEFVLNKDANHSDIDVIGFNPHKHGPQRVWAVSCKSWQSGFRPVGTIKAINERKKISGREAWKSFRELSVPKWSEGFIDAVRQATGTDKFTYVTAVAKLTGDREVWQKHAPFVQAMNGNPIQIITFAEMVHDIEGKLTKTLAATEVGRMLQMFAAAGIKLRQPA